jgi:hypothetical protein
MYSQFFTKRFTSSKNHHNGMEAAYKVKKCQRVAVINDMPQHTSDTPFIASMYPSQRGKKEYSVKTPTLDHAAIQLTTVMMAPAIRRYIGLSAECAAVRKAGQQDHQLI